MYLVSSTPKPLHPTEAGPEREEPHFTLRFRPGTALRTVIQGIEGLPVWAVLPSELLSVCLRRSFLGPELCSWDMSRGWRKLETQLGQPCGPHFICPGVTELTGHQLLPTGCGG